jgi:exonuclease III
MPYENLAVMSFEDRKIRPGLQLVAEVEGTEVAFLNVHLKAGCRSEPLGDESRVHACGDFRKQVPPLEAWIEKQVKAKRDFVVLGDWNRTLLESDLTPQQRQKGTNYDTKHPARMNTKEGATSPLAPSIKVGSMLKEISDGDPAGASVIVAQSEITAQRKTVEGEEWDYVCHLGIDHFALSPSLANRFSNQQPVARGQDYGSKAYAIDKAKPSDHCPLTLELPMLVR